MTNRSQSPRLGPPMIRRLDLAAAVRRLPTELEAGNAARATLYASPKWRNERRAFLKLHPACITPGCGQRAVVIDHRDGHEGDWPARFWNQKTWQPMCLICHARKSRAELTSWRGRGHENLYQVSGA